MKKIFFSILLQISLVIIPAKSALADEITILFMCIDEYSAGRDHSLAELLMQNVSTGQTNAYAHLITSEAVRTICTPLNPTRTLTRSDVWDRAEILSSNENSTFAISRWDNNSTVGLISQKSARNSIKKSYSNNIYMMGACAGVVNVGLTQGMKAGDFTTKPPVSNEIFQLMKDSQNLVGRIGSCSDLEDIEGCLSVLNTKTSQEKEFMKGFLGGTVYAKNKLSFEINEFLSVKGCSNLR